MRRTAIALAAAIALTGAAAPANASPKGKLKISTLSTQPEHVTGGDVLVAVDVSGGANPRQVRVRAGGRNVSGAFKVRSDNPDRLVGLVKGLPKGDTLIVANGKGVSRPAGLSVFNSPITGPVFSGPHQEPFYCRTEAAGLGPASDADCSAASTVTYYYRRNDNSFQPLADPTGPYPADGLQTTTRDGVTVDYVVRLESGVIDRSIYRFAVLAPGGEIGRGWNHRFVFDFMGGCGAGYQQGERGANTVLSDEELSQGYVVMGGSLNVFNTACNDVLSAEAAQMLKEHAIEELGEKPAWTMGQGGSGGSIQQQLIVQNYPGLLDGIMPGASFPDASGSVSPDCRLLAAYYATPEGAALSNAQRVSITGLLDPNACLGLSAGGDVINASEGCDETIVPPAEIFDPVTNPGGIRCTVWDSMIAVFGSDPSTGYARRTLDNVGVQYGLDALNAGDISVDEFLDLNEGIGGFDNNGELRATRSVADPDGLRIAYESGRVNSTAGGYTEIPTLDTRNYVDDSGINVHQYVNTYVTRARLDALHGNHDTQVMWRGKGSVNGVPMKAAALDTLARWMDAIKADKSDRSPTEKVVANKPADAVDACWIGGVRYDGVAQIGAANICEQTYPPHSLPVNRAGKPLSSLAVKCSLKPIDYGDYTASFGPVKRARMEAAFPGGVCDWSQPGPEQADLAGTWQEFGPARHVKARKRSLNLRLRRVGTMRNRRLSATATLRRCPETIFQRVNFERRRLRGGWRTVAHAFVSGRRCRASVELRLRGGARRVEVRAHAPRLEGFRGVGSGRKRG